MKTKVLLVGIAMVGVLTACEWVKPTEQGANVHVVGSENVRNCDRLGWIEVTTKPDLVFDIQRSPLKVQRELETQARNSAAKKGGDSVVATGAVNAGKQTFDMYRCH